MRPCTRRLLTAIALLHSIVALSGADARAADATPASAIEVLARFVGEWHTSATIRKAGISREIATQGKATCRATLGGTWFEFRAETIPPVDSDLQIMTYDAGSRNYRQWVFSSDGYRHEATGQWDAATATMTWTGKTADTTFVIDDHWATPDRLEWTLTRTNAQGEVVQTIEGVVTRAEKP
jgi:hypothetical protein